MLVSARIFFFLATTLFFQQEKYYVLFAKGNMKVHATSQTIKKDQEITSEDSIIFTAPDDLLIVMGSTSGKYVLKPLKAKKSRYENEFIYYVKNNLLPVRARTSSRYASSDIYDFFELNQFIVFDKLLFELPEPIELAIQASGEWQRLSQTEATVTIEQGRLDGRTSIKIYEMIDEEYEFISDIALNYVDKKELANELKSIKQTLLSDDVPTSEVDSYLYGYLSDTYGYLHSDLTEDLLGQL